MHTPKSSNKKSMIIGRKNANTTESTPQQSTQSIPDNGIILASAQAVEKDPFKIELIKNGYSIISENEYGAIVRKAQGKPSFIARTAKGYFEKGKPNTVFLPESINTAMKIHIAASETINAQQYLTQLVMKDLREKNII